MAGSHSILMTMAYQNDADGCQQELRHFTLSVVGNNTTTRSMLHHQALFVFGQLRFTSNGVTVVFTNCSEDVKKQWVIVCELTLPA
jgi:hypothetical protein